MIPDASGVCATKIRFAYVHEGVVCMQLPCTAVLLSSAAAQAGGLKVLTTAACSRRLHMPCMHHGGSCYLACKTIFSGQRGRVESAGAVHVPRFFLKPTGGRRDFIPWGPKPAATCKRVIGRLQWP